ncbi:hypothetical protein [Pricia sp.]|uniref:hypothetical protein n=1 Tax=Pricia sp. TaxID=2268138 RepID=UPI00359319BF
MKILQKKLRFGTTAVTFMCMGLYAQESSPQLVSKQFADTWGATDDFQRTLPLNDETGGLKKNRYTGIFYFTWLGAHGHDQHTKALPNEGVHPKTDSDTVSPYDITKILAANPLNPKYGPELAFHHWGEPYLGYYLSNDEWVIMKHAQLLSDAGIDVIVFDVTNALAYLPQIDTICRVFSSLEKLGWAVPKIAFLTNTKHVETTEKIYEGFYKKNKYPNLWFYWKGKPLLMGNKDDLNAEITEFFNFRRSWAWTDGQEWFGDGKDKWPWIDHYPQNYGWHESPDLPEQIVVSTGQHPISNIGRSFHNGRQPPPDNIQPGKGLFFAEQWKRALEVDPEFVFITGWNEWVAMRFNDGKAKNMMGEPVEEGDTYFVDQYNAEFSRDIEPMKGGFNDNYYYQMVGNIRKYKGSRPTIVDVNMHSIAIDGRFSDWKDVKSVYYDHKGDIQHRLHPGWGRITSYENTSGRNDFIEARTTEDDKNFYFHIKMDQNFKNDLYPEGLSLFIKNGIDEDRSWKGYGYMVKSEEGKGVLYQSKGGWRWQRKMEVAFRISDNQLELAIPKSQLKTHTEYLDFKWADNVKPRGDIMKFYDQGDVAPNARFTYRYKMLDRSK